MKTVTSTAIALLIAAAVVAVANMRLQAEVDTKMTEPDIELRCTKHPTYKAIHEPKADCAGCRKLYRMMNGRGAVARAEAMGGEMIILVDWLNENRGEHYQFSYSGGPKYYKVIMRSKVGDSESVYAFVAREDSTTKALGFVRKGAILKPASWSAPAKHERAYLYNKSTWDRALGEYSVAYRN